MIESEIAPYLAAARAATHKRIGENADWGGTGYIGCYHAGSHPAPPTWRADGVVIRTAWALSDADLAPYGPDVIIEARTPGSVSRTPRHRLKGFEHWHPPAIPS